MATDPRDVSMDQVDRALLDRAQAALPLLPRPFAALGDLLGIPEAEVLGRLRRLTEAGVLRQLSAIFDTARLGYRSTLVAASVPPERLAPAAAAVGAHPGVSHVYERDHAWNLWFTLAVPPDSRLGLEATAVHLATLAGCDRHRLLPALRVFKIGVRLDMEEGGGGAREAPGAPAGPPCVAGWSSAEAARAAVRALQEPLALVPEPFAGPAAAAGVSVDALLAEARAFLGAGVMRRFAALLHHRRAGFSANAMGVWVVPQARVAEAGATMAAFRAVSHCYQRPTFPDWPYSLFTMVHARSREACTEVLASIARATGTTEHAALWTRREFKKVRLRYFTPEYEAWEVA